MDEASSRFFRVIDPLVGYLKIILLFIKKFQQWTNLFSVFFFFTFVVGLNWLVAPPHRLESNYPFFFTFSRTIRKIRKSVFYLAPWTHKSRNYSLVGIDFIFTLVFDYFSPLFFSKKLFFNIHFLVSRFFTDYRRALNLKKFIGTD